MSRHIIGLVLLAVLIPPISCDKLEKEREKTQIEGFDDLTLDNFPFIDCSTSTSPLRDMVMYNLLDIKYKWGLDIVSGSQYALWWDMPEGMVQGSDQHKKFAARLNELTRSNGSHGAYQNLIDGNTDLIIDSRDISRNESSYAKEKGVKITTAPLARDAMVFLVNPENKVDNLSLKQIRKIYTGEITNWKQVGGEDHEIHPYVRDPDSGSQEKMETLVMQGEKMKEWPEMMLTTMLSPYFTIQADPWGIAYTPYYFCDRMVRDLVNVKVLSIDGVAPKKETIVDSKKSKTYPFVSYIYVAKRADEPASSIPGRIYDWLLSEESWDIIDESGYIALRK